MNEAFNKALKNFELSIRQGIDEKLINEQVEEVVKPKQTHLMTKDEYKEIITPLLKEYKRWLKKNEKYYVYGGYSNMMFLRTYKEMKEALKYDVYPHQVKEFTKPTRKGLERVKEAPQSFYDEREEWLNTLGQYFLRRPNRNEQVKLTIQDDELSSNKRSIRHAIDEDIYLEMIKDGKLLHKDFMGVSYEDLTKLEEQKKEEISEIRISDLDWEEKRKKENELIEKYSTLLNRKNGILSSNLVKLPSKLEKLLLKTESGEAKAFEDFKNIAIPLVLGSSTLQDWLRSDIRLHKEVYDLLKEFEDHKAYKDFIKISKENNEWYDTIDYRTRQYSSDWQNFNDYAYSNAIYNWWKDHKAEKDKKGNPIGKWATTYYNLGDMAFKLVTKWKLEPTADLEAKQTKNNHTFDRYKAPNKKVVYDWIEKYCKSRTFDLANSIVSNWYGFFKIIFDIDGSFPKLVDIKIDGFNNKGQLDSRCTFINDNGFMFVIHTRTILAGGYNIQRLHTRVLNTLWATQNGRLTAIGDLNYAYDEFLKDAKKMSDEEKEIISSLMELMNERNEIVSSQKSHREYGLRWEIYYDEESGEEVENDKLLEVNKKIRELQKKLKGFNDQD